jgi:beta-lactamase superfamily II metal-dependent hydrolase
MIFKVHSLPATYGDSFIVEYGQDSAHISHILIDGGTSGTSAEIRRILEGLPADKRHFELIVVTHIDRDHIEGILSLLQEETLGFSTNDFWYNGWSHLTEGEKKNDVETFGPKQGEYLSQALIKHGIPWNAAFDAKAIAIDPKKSLPMVDLPGGMKILILSPCISNLKTLIPKWVSELMSAGLTPGFGEADPAGTGGVERFGLQLPSTDIEELLKQKFYEDDAEANGSSIAFIAEYGGKSVLFAGDSFPSVILGSLNAVSSNKVKIDLLKLSHHGSKRNTSPALIEKLECKKYLFSTNGSKYGHPNDVTVARVITLGGEKPVLFFNYRTPYNRPWEHARLQKEYDYQTVYAENENLTIEL